MYIYIHIDTYVHIYIYIERDIHKYIHIRGRTPGLLLVLLQDSGQGRHRLRRQGHGWQIKQIGTRKHNNETNNNKTTHKQTTKTNNTIETQ